MLKVNNLIGFGVVGGNAWNISTASYSKEFNVSSEQGVCRGLFLKSDGTKAYVMGQSPDFIFQYTLSTAWDISTASYDSVSLDISSRDTNPASLTFKSDGTKLYFTGTQIDKVWEYSLSTPWDLSIATYSAQYTIIQDSGSTGIAFNTDGSKMYLAGDVNDMVFQYTLSTPWNVSTASYDSVSFDVSSQDTGLTDLFFKPDGYRLYIAGDSNDTIFQYTLSTAWDITTASYDSVSLDVTAQETTPTGIFFKSDGAKLYVIGYGTNYIHQYSL